MRAEPLKGHIYVLDLGHPDVGIMLKAKSSFKRATSSHRMHATARFVRARCRGRHPTDERMFVFDIEEGTPCQFSLKSDEPGTRPHDIYGLSPQKEFMIPGCVVLEGASAGIR
jgi:hypothetical protein